MPYPDGPSLDVDRGRYLGSVYAFFALSLNKLEEIMKFKSKISITFVYLTLYLAAVLVSASASFGQSETATVLGTVRDSNGAVMTGAAVTIRNAATALTSSTTTDANGD